MYEVDRKDPELRLSITRLLKIVEASEKKQFAGMCIKIIGQKYKCIA